MRYLWICVTLCLLVGGCSLLDTEGGGGEPYEQSYFQSYVRTLEDTLEFRYDVSWHVRDTAGVTSFDASVASSNLSAHTINVIYPSWALGVLLFETDARDGAPKWNSRARIDPETGRMIIWPLDLRNERLNPNEDLLAPEFAGQFLVEDLFTLESLAEGRYYVQIRLELEKGEETFEASSVVLDSP